MTKVVEVFVTAASTLSLTAFDGGSHLSLDCEARYNRNKQFFFFFLVDENRNK